jgi:NAD(P)-dependent dehydrogenase (short-subunit alcohol dehydrogenase family)
MSGIRPGRVAVVSGGTGAIGRAVVDRLLQAQGKVHVLDLRSIGSPPGAAVHIVDTSDQTALESAIAQIASREGRIDHLVYCAGIFRPAQFMALTADALVRTLAINLYGAFVCCSAILPLMRNNGFGRIVLLSSMLAHTGAANGADYAMSKGGILGLVRSQAAELGGNNIYINSVSPGVVDTPMPRAHSTDEMLTAVGRTTPIGRIATVDDVANACLYLLDEQCGLNGQDLRVNGGANLW